MSKHVVVVVGVGLWWCWCIAVHFTGGWWCRWWVINPRQRQFRPVSLNTPALAPRVSTSASSSSEAAALSSNIITRFVFDQQLLPTILLTPPTNLFASWYPPLPIDTSKCTLLLTSPPFHHRDCWRSNSNHGLDTRSPSGDTDLAAPPYGNSLKSNLGNIGITTATT